MAIAPLQIPNGQAWSAGADFTPLAQLGEQIKRQQQEAVTREALATGDPRALIQSGQIPLAQLGIQMQNRQADQARLAQQDQRQLGRDAVEDNFRRQSLGIQQANSDRDKPTPFETIGGTKFMVRDGKGGYRVVDPAGMGQPAPAQPAQTQSPDQGGAPAPQALAAGPDAVDPQSGRREGYLQTLDPQIRDYIKKVADYEIDPRTTSVKGGMREKLLSAVAKYDPTYDQNTFGSRAKAVKDFSSGPQGNIIRSFNVAIDHLELLSKAADAMQNGDTKILNSVRNAWREQTGSELPTNFNSLKPLVSGEIAKAAIGSNNALADREELRQPLNAANSGPQITGVIKQYKGLMAGQLHGLKKQYEDTTGRKDFDKRLTDHTRKELESAMQGPKAAPITVDGYTIKEN